MIHCHELNNKKDGSFFRTFEKAVQARMIPQFTGADNVAAVWSVVFFVVDRWFNNNNNDNSLSGKERFTSANLTRKVSTCSFVCSPTSDSMVFLSTEMVHPSSEERWRMIVHWSEHSFPGCLRPPRKSRRLDWKRLTHHSPTFFILNYML